MLLKPEIILKWILALLFTVLFQTSFCQSDTLDFGVIGKYVLLANPDSTVNFTYFDSTWTKRSEGTYAFLDSVECENCQVSSGMSNYITDTRVFLFEGKCAIPIGDWKDYDSNGIIDKITLYTEKFHSYEISNCDYRHEEIKTNSIAKPCPGSIIYEALPSRISYFKNNAIVRIEYYAEGKLDRVMTYSE